MPKEYSSIDKMTIFGSSIAEFLSLFFQNDLLMMQFFILKNL